MLIWNNLYSCGWYSRHLFAVHSCTSLCLWNLPKFPNGQQCFPVLSHVVLNEVNSGVDPLILPVPRHWLRDDQATVLSLVFWERETAFLFHTSSPEETLSYSVQCSVRMWIWIDRVIWAWVKSCHMELREVNITRGKTVYEMPVEASSKTRITYGLFICMSQYTAVIIRGLMGIMMHPENCRYFLGGKIKHLNYFVMANNHLNDF